MDHQWQAGRARRSDMGAEPLLLRRARRVVIVVVEPCLPDRHHFGMTRALDQVVRADVELLVGVVWVRADRAKHVRKALCDGDQIALPPHPRRNRHHPTDAGGLGALDHAVELRP